MDYNALVYSKETCPWCEKALDLLESEGYVIRVLKFQEDFTKDELINVIPKGRRPTVPQIFIKEKYIGGYEDLLAYVKDSHGTSRI